MHYPSPKGGRMHRNYRRIKFKRKKREKLLHPVTLFFACFFCSFLFVLFIGNQTQEYSLENLELKKLIKIPERQVQKTERIKAIRNFTEKISQNK
jgi:hypothetical protein